MNFLKKMFRDQSGQGMVEYGLIIALVAIVVIGAMTLLGTEIGAVFTAIRNALGVATP